MKTQAIINIVFAVALVGYVVSQRNPTFDTITCKVWHVVDADGKERITAFTNPDGDAGVQWLDKDGKMRINAGILFEGHASVSWLEKDRKVRIGAGTLANGQAGVSWLDKDGKERISASTLADGTVELPTEDLAPPKEP